MPIFGYQTVLMSNTSLFQEQLASGSNISSCPDDQEIKSASPERADRSEGRVSGPDVDELHPVPVKDISAAYLSKQSQPSYSFKDKNADRRKRRFFILLFIIALLIGLSICSVGWVFKKHPQPPKIVQVQNVPQKKEYTPPPVEVPKEKPQQPPVNDGKEKDLRRNWSKYINAGSSNYAYGVLGGINNLSILFYNKTDYPIEELTAKVTYIKANGKPWKSKLVSIYNLSPHSERKQAMSKVNRGKSVEVRIIKATSKKMHFRYEEGKTFGTPDDPYLMK